MNKSMNKFLWIISKLGQFISSILIFTVGVLRFGYVGTNSVTYILTTIAITFIGGAGLFHTIKYEIYDAIQKDLDKQN